MAFRAAALSLGVTSAAALVVVLLLQRTTTAPRFVSRDDSQRLAATEELVEAQDRAIAQLRAELERRRRPPLGRARNVVEETLTSTATTRTNQRRRPLLVAHVINPMPNDHGFHVDQEITFASLVAAKRNAKTVDVAQYTTEFADDTPCRTTPPSFARAANLTSHAHALYEMASRGVGFRKLPLVSDILAALDAAAEEEAGSYDRVLLVYTNTDIAVQPDFYDVVAKLAEARSAFVINRVEIPASSSSKGRPFDVQDLPALYTLGKQRPQLHAGYDCFVWDRRATPFLRLYARGLFVGYPPVGRHLRDALACVFGPSHFAEVKGQKHTFHVGDRNGGWNTFPEFEHFNRKAARHAEAAFAAFLGPNPCRRAQKAINYGRRRRGGQKQKPTTGERPHDDGGGGGDVVLLHKVRAELDARPFERWDIPGSDWPPTPRRHLPSSSSSPRGRKN